MPLGISQPIEPGGVFPLMLGTAEEEDVAQWYGHDNYLSYEDYRSGAEDILRREYKEEWLDWAPHESVVEQKYGKATYSRIDVIAKTKNERLKLRQIYDLRRSGIKAKVAAPERISLPRLTNGRDDRLRLIRTAGHLNWEAVTLAAVRSPRGAPSPLRACATGHVIYLTVLIGIRSGPLVWGRVAALLMRLTATMHIGEQA